MSSSPNLRNHTYYSKKFWIESLNNFYWWDKNIETIQSSLENWVQEINHNTHRYSPNFIRHKLITDWNLWVNLFKSSHFKIFEYLRKRGILRIGINFLHQINHLKKASFSKFASINKKFRISQFFISLDQFIRATIDILEQRNEELSWIRPFFNQQPLFKKITLNIIRRSDTQSFIFNGRIHPSSE